MRDNDFIKKSGYLPDAGALTQELMTKAALVNWYINYLKKVFKYYLDHLILLGIISKV